MLSKVKPCLGAGRWCATAARGAMVAGLSIALVSPVVAQATSRPAASQAEAAKLPPGFVAAEDGQVIFIHNIRVPAQVEGVLTDLLAHEGAVVEKGQTLAILDDRDSQLALKLKKAEEEEARLNATNDINRQYAERSHELSTEKADAYEELQRERVMSKWEARQARLEAYRDQLQISLAIINQDIAKAQHGAKSVEREIAEVSVDKRQVTAPFNGFVEQRIAQPGEWVQPGAPIVKLVQMDRLRAQGFLNYEVANQVTVGMPAVLEFEMGGGRTERINATVGFVGYDIDLSQRRRVWVEFDNQRIGNDWMIKPGMKLRLIIDTNAAR